MVWKAERARKSGIFCDIFTERIMFCDREHLCYVQVPTSDAFMFFTNNKGF